MHRSHHLFGEISMSDPFKFVDLDTLKSLNSPIVTVITAEDVQDIAGMYCDGPLAEDELQQFDYTSREWCFDELFSWIFKTIPHARACAQEMREFDRQIA